jgi:hypothetical protein
MARPNASLSSPARRALNHADEWWRTPPDGTAAFMIAEGDRLRALGGKIWECACGDGAMARVIEAFGFDVIATNLTGRGYGRSGVDFLKTRKGRARAVVTNPPFSRAVEFARHWARLGLDYLAMLLPATFFHAGQTRGHFFNHELPPARVLPLGFRLDFEARGAPPMECSWFIWERGSRGVPGYGPVLMRP